MIESETERQLRESLRRRAEQAPQGTLLAERIIAAAGAPDGRIVRRSFRTQRWVTPLLSAAAVAAVAIAIATTSQSDRHDTAASGKAAASAAVSYGGRMSVPSSGAATQPSVTCAAAPCGNHTQSRAAGQSTAGSTSAAPSSTHSAVPTVTGFRVSDLTFVSDTEGWAFGTANCLNGSAGQCPAMMHTTDGSHWLAMPPPPIDPAHADLGIRFANDQVGYAFDPTVLFMTTDGGHRWQRQAGGALALETLDNNVVRVVSPHSGCPGPCEVRVEGAAVGSSSWTTWGTYGRSGVASVQLARSGSDVYLLLRRNPVGGAPGATSTLVYSTDSGSGSMARGEPCPQGSGRTGEVDSVAVSAGAAGRVTVLCRPRLPGQSDFVVTSADAGAHFSAAAAGRLPQQTELLAGDYHGTLLAGGSTGVYRSTDGGASWQRVAQLGAVKFLGFESPSVARAVSADGRTIWSTPDGGVQWFANP